MFQHGVPLSGVFNAITWSTLSCGHQLEEEHQMTCGSHSRLAVNTPLEEQSHPATISWHIQVGVEQVFFFSGLIWGKFKYFQATL